MGSQLGQLHSVRPGLGLNLTTPWLAACRPFQQVQQPLWSFNCCSAHVKQVTDRPSATHAYIPSLRIVSSSFPRELPYRPVGIAGLICILIRRPHFRAAASILKKLDLPLRLPWWHRPATILHLPLSFTREVPDVVLTDVPQGALAHRSSTAEGGSVIVLVVVVLDRFGSTRSHAQGFCPSLATSCSCHLCCTTALPKWQGATASEQLLSPKQGWHATSSIASSAAAGVGSRCSSLIPVPTQFSRKAVCPSAFDVPLGPRHASWKPSS